MKERSLAIMLSVLPVLAAGCRSNYVSQLGLESGDSKAELARLVDQARETQLDAQREFQEAHALLDQMMSASPDEPLDGLFGDFQGELEDCAQAAARLDEEVVGIEQRATMLFGEWETGLELYTSPMLRQKSQLMLEETRMRVDELVGDLVATQQAMQPVLSTYGDYALFFHHNLNVTAIGTLADTRVEFLQLNTVLYGEIESDVAAATSFGEFLDGRAGLDTVVIKP